MSFFKDKRYLVIGGTGSIGSAIVERLANQQAVISVGSRQALQIEDDLATRFPAANVQAVQIDLQKSYSESLAKALATGLSFDGVINSVGLCPPQGFAADIAQPLSTLDGARFAEKMNTYVLGLFTSWQWFAPHIKEGGSFTAITSAITRLTAETAPPFLNCWHYHAAKAAQDSLVQGCRHDALTRQKNLMVHRIAPAAIETPFHNGTPAEMRPPKMLPISVVVDEVENALQNSDHVDVDIMPDI